MNIPERLRKINLLNRSESDLEGEEFHYDDDGEVIRNSWVRKYFLALAVILVSTLSFGVGRLTSSDREGVEINFDPSLLESKNGENLSQIQSATVINSEEATEGSVEASVNGTRYYYEHCGNNIAEKNKVVFTSHIEAEKAGYTIALNCKP
ncbi:MAG: hypothetical protein ACYCY6_01685 [Minisyncoccota bacterium]